MTAAATDSTRLPARDSPEVCSPRKVEVGRSVSIAGRPFATFVRPR